MWRLTLGTPIILDGLAAVAVVQEGSHAFEEGTAVVRTMGARMFVSVGGFAGAVVALDTSPGELDAPTPVVLTRTGSRRVSVHEQEIARARAPPGPTSREALSRAHEMSSARERAATAARVRMEEEAAAAAARAAAIETATRAAAEALEAASERARLAEAALEAAAFAELESKRERSRRAEERLMAASLARVAVSSQELEPWSFAQPLRGVSSRPACGRR